jgi:nucleoside-diphosphate-sugar epimerase
MVENTSSKPSMLITGANGFLGKQVTKRVASMNKWEVYAIVSGRNAVQLPESVHIIKADLLDIKQCERIMREIQPEIMLHYAWHVQEGKFEESMENIVWLEVSLQLLRFFSVYNGRRFLFAGSVSEYGTANEKHLEIPEPEQLTLYGETKRAFANILKNYCTSKKIEYVDMRYCSVYGEGDNRLYAFTANAIYSLIKNKPFECNYPENIWDYIYIDDAVDVTQRLIDSDYCGSINICSGLPHKMGDILMIIGKELKKENLIILNSNNGCNRVFVSDTGLVEKILGYKCKTPITIGLKKTIEYFENAEYYKVKAHE